MFSALWLGFDAINFSIRESNGMHDANMTAMASLADISGDPRSYYEYRDKHELEKQILLFFSHASSISSLNLQSQMIKCTSF